MASETKDEQSGEPPAASPGPKPPPLNPPPQEVPPVPPTKPAEEPGSGASGAKARLEKNQAAYKERQDRVKSLGTEASGDRYRQLTRKPPELPLNRLLVDRIAAKLLKMRFVLLECVEQRVLQDVRLWLWDRPEFSRYSQIAPNRENEGIDEYLDVQGPALLILTATPTLLNSVSNRKELQNFERITEILEARNIAVLVCAASMPLRERLLHKDDHLLKYLIRANEIDNWLLPLLIEGYPGSAREKQETLKQQRDSGLWPADDRAFHTAVSSALAEGRLDDEMKSRSRPSHLAERWRTTQVEDIIEDGTKDVETCLLFLRAYISSESPYILEKSLEVLLGSASRAWKRFIKERGEILGLVQAFDPDHIRMRFEGSRGALLRMADAVVERLLPVAGHLRIESACVAAIASAAILDPEGYGRRVVLRSVCARTEASPEAWAKAVASGGTERLKRANALVVELVAQSETIPIVAETLEVLMKWQRTADALEIVEGLGLSCALGGKTVSHYFARALNEGSEEARKSAREKLRYRAWNSPKDFMDVLLATKEWLPADGSAPSQAATSIMDVITETLEARLVRGSADGSYQAHPRLVNLVVSAGEGFLEPALHFLLHPAVQEYVGSLIMVHESFLVDMWAVPASLRSQALQRREDLNFEYLVTSLAALLDGLRAGAQAFGKRDPPLFAAMLVVEWALASGPADAVKSLDRVQKRALAACWNAIDRSLEFGAAALGRLALKPKPAVEFARTIRKAIRSVKAANAVVTV